MNGGRYYVDRYLALYMHWDLPDPLLSVPVATAEGLTHTCIPIVSHAATSEAGGNDEY